MEQALLPAGLHDLLAPNAQVKSDLSELLTKIYTRFGYQLTEAPLMEFEDSLFYGSGEELKNKTFRIMDPLSHKMMGLRADITTQIARIAATRLVKEAIPLKLAYSGHVFRTKGEGLYAERQLMQAGVELIGVDSAHADAEVILITISALLAAGIKNLTIDFFIPKLVTIIMQNSKCDEVSKASLSRAINQKNVPEVKILLEKIQDKSLLVLEALTKPKIDIQELLTLKLPKEAGVLCSRLAAIIDIIKTSTQNITILIDPVETTSFSYHSGIGFMIYANVENAKSPIAKGGRYEINSASGSVMPATGASIYIEELMRITPKKPGKAKMFIPFGLAWQEINHIMQNTDYIMVLGSADNSATKNNVDIKLLAKDASCEYVFHEGKICPL